MGQRERVGFLEAGQEANLSVSPSLKTKTCPQAVAALGEDEESEEEPGTGEPAQGR